MISIKRYSKDNALEWNSFNSSAKNSLFMFDRKYMDYHSDRFVDHSLLFYSDEDLVAILPASEKENALVSHGGLTYGGFIVSNTMKQSLMMDCMQSLREYMSVAKLTKIIYKTIPFIYWDQPAEEDQYALYRSEARLKKIEASTVINLRNTLDMAKLRKRMIKKATKEGVSVSEESTDDSYKEFIDLQNCVLNQHHGVNAVHTADELILLRSRFPENIRLIAARRKDKMIAGTLIFEYDNVVHTQYLAANDEARKIGALDLVVSEVIEKYRLSKMWLDFGISTENDGLYLNEGLISQKEGFGGRTIVYKTWEIRV